jgi:hypothetical protein
MLTWEGGGGRGGGELTGNRAHKTFQCHSDWGVGEQTDQSESAACHLGTLPIPSQWPLPGYSKTEVVDLDSNEKPTLLITSVV